MREAIQESVVKLIERRSSELNQLSLNWFGGEPLLGLSVIRNIGTKSFELAKKHGYQLTGSMTTNGYLLDAKTLRELVAINHDFYQISLDGWQEGHDKTRKRADGKGTFDKIWRNLLEARDTDLKFEILLRIHITHENTDSLSELLLNIGKQFGGDNRFRLNFQDVRNMGGDNGENVVSVAPDAFKHTITHLQRQYRVGFESTQDNSTALAESFQNEMDLMQKAQAQETKSGESAGSRRAYLIEEDEPYICYAAKPNFFMIRADGRIGKCTVALDDRRNQLGHINNDGELILDDSRMRPWFDGFAELNIEQLGCPIQFIQSPPPVVLSAREIPVTVSA